MGLYLGSEPLRVRTDKGAMALFIGTPMADTIRLLSSDGYTLLDANGVYLLPKEDE